MGRGARTGLGACVGEDTIVQLQVSHSEQEGGGGSRRRRRKLEKALAPCRACVLPRYCRSLCQVPCLCDKEPVSGHACPFPCLCWSLCQMPCLCDQEPVSGRTCPFPCFCRSLCRGIHASARGQLGKLGPRAGATLQVRLGSYGLRRNSYASAHPQITAGPDYTCKMFLLERCLGCCRAWDATEKVLT